MYMYISMYTYTLCTCIYSLVLATLAGGEISGTSRLLLSLVVKAHLQCLLSEFCNTLMFKYVQDVVSLKEALCHPKCDQFKSAYV